MRHKLHVIVCSTRPGRVGLSVAQWFHALAAEHPAFDVELVDLQEAGLPIYDEPKHPRLQAYEHDHTKRWSASVAAADAFVFVTPEYNFGPPPALTNALNFVYTEWNYKPAGFVSYGGFSGGVRAVELAKATLTTLKVVPLLEAVVVPMVAQFVQDGAFGGTPIMADAAGVMLKELDRWATALTPMRG